MQVLSIPLYAVVISASKVQAAKVVNFSALCLQLTSRYFTHRSLRQLKKEVKSKLAAKQLSKPAQSSTSSIYTDVHVPKKASEDDEAISSLTDAIGGQSP